MKPETAVAECTVLALLVLVTARLAEKRQRAALQAAEQAGGGVAVPAGLWIRVAARIADYLPLELALALVLAMALVLDALQVGLGWVVLAAVVSYPALFVLYFTILTARRGDTHGKRLAGLTVTRVGGSRLGWGRCFVRSVVDLVGNGLAFWLVGLLDPLFVVFTRTRRAIHDLVAGSSVQASRPPSRWLPWHASLGVVAPVLLVFGFLRPLLAQAFYLPSESMAPTLQVGDRVIANKLAYRLGKVQRGDLVVFLPPRGAAPESDDRVFLQRVIALPGDTVSIRRGAGVYVSGKLLPDPPHVPLPEYDWPADEWGRASEQPYRVPEGACFVLGDNRNRSYDSHIWADRESGKAVPELPIRNIVGRVSLCYWPLFRLGPVGRSPSEGASVP